MTDQSVPFSPIAVVGTISLLAAYLLAAWCVAAGIAGNARKSRRLVSSSVYGLYGFGALVSLASADFQKLADDICAKTKVAAGCPIRTDAEQAFVVESTELMAKCPSKYEGATSNKIDTNFK